MKVTFLKLNVYYIFSKVYKQLCYVKNINNLSTEVIYNNKLLK
jgi:hypothetical protein